MKRPLVMLMILLGGTAAEAALSPPVFPDWGYLLLVPDSGQVELLELARIGMSGGAHLGDRFTIQGDLDLLLRHRDSEQLQDYRAYEKRFTWQRHGGNHWLRCDLSRRRSEMRQRNIYSDNDRLVADGRGDVVRFVAGLRDGGLGLQVGLGRARERVEFSAVFMRSIGTSLLQFELATGETSWELEQSFTERRYHFDFPLHGERLSAGFFPGHRFCPTLQIQREEISCNSQRLMGDFNRLQALRRGGSLAWDPGGDWPAVAMEVQRGELSLRMFADGVSYLYLPRLEHHTHAVSLTSSLPGGLWLQLGQREQKLDADDGYGEPWPFVVWAIFTNDRYGIDLLQYRLLVWSAGLGRKFRLGSRHRFDLSLNHLWLSGGGGVDWKKRVWTMPPFFFRNVRAHADLPLPAKRVLRLDLSLRSRIYSAWQVELSLRQLLPLDNLIGDGGDVDAPPSPPVADDAGGFAFGGLRISLRIDHDLK